MTLSIKLESSESVLRVISNIKTIKLNDFNDRLSLQKLGFLIQKIQQSEPYYFSWYVKGPYSSKLASTLFFHEEKGTYEKPPKLSDFELDIQKKTQVLLGSNIKNPSYLELYASLWYLMSKGQISKSEREQITSIMFKEKPQFSRKDVILALTKISKFRKKYSL
jgi:uncharacterized protein YwgA